MIDIYLKTRAVAVPGSKTLRMLGSYTSSCSIWASENNGNIDLQHKMTIKTIGKTGELGDWVSLIRIY